MMDNASIYSGLSAHPAREIAQELRRWEPFAADENFMLLLGAFTTLALEVDRITPRVVDHDNWPPARDPAEQLALVYAGLREVCSMLETGYTLTQREPESNRVHALGGVILAVQARIYAMLEAGGQPSAPPAAARPEA